MSVEKKNYRRKIRHQNLQNIHPKHWLGLVYYADKFLANYDSWWESKPKSYDDFSAALMAVDLVFNNSNTFLDKWDALVA
jgi:hypothetical protein